jgi:enamine deaminase RidA (YjgF/YER057c/UK114 family)
MRSVLQPEGWPRPKGYANGIVAEGRMVFVAGQIGWNERQELASGLLRQVEQALLNIVAVLRAANAGPDCIVRMTWYLKDMDDYIANLSGIGEAYRRIIGRHFPTMTAIEVRRLAEPGALVEIEATGVVSS